MWAGWPVERTMYLFLAVVYFAIFVQVTLFHWRQNFRHWAMWIPVIALPTLGALATLITMRSTAALTGVFAAVAVVGVGAGLVGSYFHWVGVGERVDGYTLNNFMVGPPPMLPLMVSATSALGLIVVYWI